MVSEPDFPLAGLELKTSPLKRLKSKKLLVAKERLVLNIINYYDVVDEEFEESSFYYKNKHLLLVFYLYESKQSALEYVIELVADWEYPEEDLEIIRKDWNTIKTKIEEGKAHELSEGDTSYLGACTKSANSRKLRKQPNNDKPAKPRAFSLKQGYVNHIIATLGNKDGRKYGRLFESKEVAVKETIESLVLKRLKDYYGKSTSQIERDHNLDLNQKSKSYYHNLTKAILGIGTNETIQEFEKADIKFKTVRIEDNKIIEQAISFPAFDFYEVLLQDWEESRFKDIVEGKFLFVFFKKDGNDYYLEKAMFWNMGFNDRLECERIYNETKAVIRSGEIVWNIKKQKNGIIYQNNFPKIRNSKVCHVRPHAIDREDKLPLPVPDKMTGMKAYTKQCFWLDKNYVLREIYKSI